MASDTPNDTSDGDNWLRWHDENEGGVPADHRDAEDLDVLAEDLAPDATAPEPEKAGTEPSSDLGDFGLEAADQLPARVSNISAGKIDNVPAAIGALSMRIDSLIAATTTYRSVLSDRLAEYADLVNRLNRTQASDLDEFRKANERTVTEIRRTLTTTEEALREVKGDSERLVSDVTSLTDQVRTSASDSRELLDATDKLGRFVTEALDQFAERVLSELRAITDSVTPELGTVRSELALTRESLDDLNERASSAPVRESIDELRSDMSGLRRAVLEWPDLELVREETIALRADMSSLLEASGLADDGTEAPMDRALAELAAIRGDLRSIIEDADDEALTKFVSDLEHVRASLSQLPDRAELLGRLADVRTDIESVLASVSSDERGEALRAEVDRIESRLGEIPTIENLRAEITAALIDGTPTTSESLDADLSELRAGLAAVRAAITEFRETAGGDVGAQLAELRQVIEGAGDRSGDDVSSKLDSLHEVVRRLADREPSGSDVNAELDALREAVERVGERSASSGGIVEAVSAELSGVRDEITALREAERSADDATVGELSAIRQTLDGLTERGSDPSRAEELAVEITALRDEVVALRAAVAEQPAATVEGVPPAELTALRDELKALRRRIKVRAADDAPTLDDDQLQLIVDGVAAALREQS